MYSGQIPQDNGAGDGKGPGIYNVGRGCWGEVWGTVNRASMAGTQGSWEDEMQAYVHRVRGFPAGA